GTRVAVAKAEVRFPLAQQFILAEMMVLPPVEGFAFVDGGVAWNTTTQPVLRRGLAQGEGERGILTSAGVGARVNLFGYLVVEMNYLRAFSLSDDWRWQFNFIPGF